MQARILCSRKATSVNLPLWKPSSRCRSHCLSRWKRDARSQPPPSRGISWLLTRARGSPPCDWHSWMQVSTVRVRTKEHTFLTTVTTVRNTALHATVPIRRSLDIRKSELLEQGVKLLLNSWYKFNVKLSTLQNTLNTGFSILVPLWALEQQHRPLCSVYFSKSELRCTPTSPLKMVAIIFLLVLWNYRSAECYFSSTFS